MPMVGVVLPGGKEAMPHPEGLPEWLPPEELLNRLANAELGESQWTYEMAAAAMGNVQDRGDMLSTTAITTGCVRGEVIKRKEAYVADLNDLYAALRGTMAHRTLELSTPPGSIAEVRFTTTVDGIKLSGQPDMLTPKYLVDYKVPGDQKSIPMQYLYTSQVEQLMLNAFICRHAEDWDEDADLAFDPRDYPVESVGIVFQGPVRPKVMVYKKAQDVTLPSGKTRKLRVPYVWSDDETLHAIRPRLHLLQSALASYPEWPEPYTDPDTGIEWTLESLWGGEAGSWKCPGWPACKFPTCIAKRTVLTW